MTKTVLKTCPVCGEELIVSKLKCTACDMEYSGSFQAAPFANLSDDELDFVKAFLKNEGNISRLQNESGRSYASIKTLLNDVNVKLGTVKEKKESVNMELFEHKAENGIVKVIQDKLLACGGSAKMPMLKGEPLDIWLAASGKGIENSGFTSLLCEWHILEAIVKKANELGGVMYRGDAGAHGGAKIGSEALPVDTIDAFIALHFYGASVGDTTLRRSTYYAGILAWAGIVENHRSKGEGGYIVVKPAYREV